MTIDEAIKILTIKPKQTILELNEKNVDALLLAIEALAAIKCGREGLRTEFHTPLIGESIE